MTAREDKKGSKAPVVELYPLQGQWTEEDHFALLDTHRLVELSEGRLIMPPHPTLAHQEAVKRSFLPLHVFAGKRKLGVVEIAPLPLSL